MRIHLKKDKFKTIEGAFGVLKEDYKNNAACKMIKDSLEDCFDVSFEVNIIEVTNKYQPVFVMSVFPEMSTIDKIVASIMSNGKKKYDDVRKLWEQNKSWVIEVDNRIFDANFINCTERELTALLLHEVGHVIFTNSVPARIATILEYEVAKSNMNNRVLLRDRMFRKLLSLPILNACVANGKKSNHGIGLEIKADNFAKKMGYTSDLASVLKKLISSGQYSRVKGSINDNMKNMTNFSVNTIDQLRTRQSKLMKNNLLTLKKECVSPYIESAIDDICNMFFTEEGSLSNGKQLILMQERADKLLDDGEIMTEFFIFKTKSLKRIDPAELDYIEVKMTEIKSASDKMMLLSYLHNKLDNINYYMQILSDPQLSKKYSIPHSYDQLLMMKKRLKILREQIIKFKIPEKNKELLIMWPKGYEG